MKCYQAKAGELQKHWYVIDATDMVVGRLAAQIAPILMGKHRPTYTPHIDTGDFVVVTNVEKVVFTGNKWQQKSYQWYTGHPGGQKEEVAWKLLQRRPERILMLAVQRMMPKNKIGRHMLSKLKLCVGPTHPHQAQSPIPLEALGGRPTPTGGVFRVIAPPKPRKPRPGTTAPITQDALPAPAAAEAHTAETPSSAPTETQGTAPTETPSPTPAPASPAVESTPAPAGESAPVIEGPSEDEPPLTTPSAE